MRIVTTLAIIAATLAAVPVEARRTYDCRTDKRNAGHQGIAIGAVAGGVGTALLGGGVGTSLLGAAAGGTAGNFIGRGQEKCNRRGYYRGHYSSRNHRYTESRQ